MVGLVYATGLLKALERFKSNGRSAKQDKWEIIKGTSGIDWELSYDTKPVVQCVNGIIDNIGLSGPMFRKVAPIIQQAYPKVRFSEEGLKESFKMDKDAKMGNVIKSGTVTVKKPFQIQWFDEDDGWVKFTVKPDDYEYRVLNVRGWKPRQLKLDGEWQDVADTCKELEQLLSELDETTTVANVAPTKDYFGSDKKPLKPMSVLSPDETTEVNFVPGYDQVAKAPADSEKSDDWVSPLGRILAGESARKVFGKQFGIYND